MDAKKRFLKRYYCVQVFGLLVIWLLAGCQPPPKAIKETPSRTALTLTITETPAALPTATKPQGPIEIGHFGKGVMSSVIQSHNGRILAVGIGNVLHWYDAQTFQEMGSFSFDQNNIIEKIFFSPDDRLVAVNSDIVDLDRKSIIATIDTYDQGLADNISFTPDNQYVAYRVYRGRWSGHVVNLWNTQTNAYERTFDVINPNKYHHMAWPVISPDGKFVAAGCDKQVYIWDLATGKRKFLFEGFAENVLSLDFSADGKWLAAASFEHTVRVWDMTTGGRLQLVSGLEDEIRDVKFSADSKQLKMDPFDSSTSYIWDTVSKKVSKVDKGKDLLDDYAASMHRQGFSQYWLQSGSGAISFSPDGKTLAVGSQAILLWDVQKQTVIASLENPKQRSIRTMQYSPNGRWLAAHDDLSNLKVWDVNSKSIHKVATNALSFAFSADSSLLAFDTTGGVVEIWDVESDTLRYTIKLNSKIEFSVESLDFSPEADQIHAMRYVNNLEGGSHVVQTWDLATGAILDTFELPKTFGPMSEVADLHWPYFVRSNSNDTNFIDNSQYWIELWNLETRKIVSKAPIDRSDLYKDLNLQLRPDGTVSSTNDNLWHILIPNQPVFTVKLPHPLTSKSITISPDYHTLAIDQLGIIYLWDISQAAKAMTTPSP